MTIAARKVVLVLIASCGLLAMIIIANARSSGSVAHAAGTVQVHVKQASLTDQNCGSQTISGGHFVINQITEPPSTITVRLSDGSSHVVPLSHQTSKVAQYTLNFSPGLQILDATAWVPAGWSGQFVLSNYLCGGPTPTSPSTPPSSGGPSS
jgi:hypothetical protein